MKIMKVISAYQCSLCGKVLKTKKAAEKHDALCISDPNNKTCKTCNLDGRCKIGMIRFAQNCHFWEAIDKAQSHTQFVEND